MPKRKVAHRKRKQTGAGAKDVAKKVFNIVKENKLLSRGLSLIPHPAAQIASSAASQFGLGRKRKSKRKRTSTAGSIAVVAPVVHHVRRRIPNVVKTNQQHGAGIFSDLGGGIGSVFGGLGSGIGSIPRGVFG
mgnify:CR=1 FL=1